MISIIINLSSVRCFRESIPFQHCLPRPACHAAADLAAHGQQPSTAEDLLQETYLRVTRALSEHPVDHLEPFVFQTARNLALDHLRARRIQSRTLMDDVPLAVMQNVAAPLSTAEDAAHAEQILQRLSVSLARLSARQQRIFILSRLHGRGYQEIANSSTCP